MKSWATRLMSALAGEVFTHKWIGTEKLKKQILEGNLDDLKVKAFVLELLDIQENPQFPGCNKVILRIKVIDRDGDDITYVDYEEGLMIGDTLTLMDLDNALRITLS